MGRLSLPVTLLPIAGALTLLLLGALPVPLLRALADALAGDGSSSMILQDAAAVQRRLVLCGGALLAIGILFAALALRTTWRPPRVRLRELPPRLVAFFREEPRQAWALAGLTLLGALCSFLLLSKPITCDESYTAIFFASRPTLAILCNYISPNNHVLHSLLAHGSLRLLGDEPWALRLPAWLAGVACVPAAYAAARAHFGRASGLLAAGAVATWPYLADVATNARGYPLVQLSFLSAVALAPRLLHAEARRAWIAFVLLVAVGFWSVPVAIYPFSALFLWLLWGSARELRPGERGPFLSRLALASTAVVLLSALLYLPSFVVHGDGIAFAREFMRPELPEAGSWARLRERLSGEAVWTAGMWRYGLGAAALPLLAIAAAAGLVLGPRESRASARLWVLAALLGPLAIVLSTSKVPPGRCVTFLLLTLLLVAAFGLASLLERLAALRPPGRGLVPVALVGIAVAGGAGTLRHRTDQWRSPWYDGYAEAEQAARFLADAAGPRDRILGVREERPPLHYYHRRLTGGRLYAFYPFDPETRAMIRINPDMRADDEATSVDHVWLIDTYRGGMEHLIEALEKSGFRRSEREKRFAHSRLVLYDNVVAERISVREH